MERYLEPCLGLHLIRLQGREGKAVHQDLALHTVPVITDQFSGIVFGM